MNLRVSEGSAGVAEQKGSSNGQSMRISLRKQMIGVGRLSNFGLPQFRSVHPNLGTDQFRKFVSSCDVFSTVKVCCTELTPIYHKESEESPGESELWGRWHRVARSTGPM